MAEEAKLIEPKAIYEFDGFRVDPTNRLLLRDGKAVPLTAKTFDLLLVFIESNGRLLGKDEVMRRVWPQNFVEEGNLTRQVSTLRRALGEAPKSHQYITTVPGYGYKFVASIKEVQEPPAITLIADHTVATTIIEEEISPPTVTPAPRALRATQENLAAIQGTKRKRAKLLLIGAVCLVGMAPIAMLIVRKEKPLPPSSQAGVKSIAVLPLKPLNAQTRDPVYELGIADSLILKLSGVKEIIVRPLSATRKYTSPEQDPLAAGREQQVDYVLAPSYQLADGKIRVTAQLFNVRDGSVASVKCDESCTDIFAAEDAISEKVGRVLLTRLTSEQNSRLAQRYTNNEEAYRLYLQGKYILDRWDRADFRKAIDAFEQAIRLDPNYALAYAELAWAHRSVSYTGLDSGEENRKAREAVVRALALDDSLAEGYSALGEIRDNYDWDFPAGEQAHKRALELNPNSPEAHAKYGIHLMILGRLDEAMSEIKSAINLEPMSLFNNRLLGDALYWSRRYDEAIAQFKRVVAMDANFRSAYSFLWISYEMKGDYEQAFEWYSAGHRLGGASARDLEALKTAYTKLGWRGVLQHEIDHWRQEEKTGVIVNAGLASLYAQLGSQEQAFSCLEKAYEKHEAWIMPILVDPELDPLRSDPRFQDLVRRIGLQQ